MSNVLVTVLRNLHYVQYTAQNVVLEGVMPFWIFQIKGRRKCDSMKQCSMHHPSVNDLTPIETSFPLSLPSYTVLEGFEIPHPDDQFRSNRTIGQHLFTKQTVAPALMDQILAAWSPNFHVLTPHWEDGRDAMHMFSNPDFFFEHWRINIQREAMQRRATVDMLSVSQFNVVFGEGFNQE